MFDISIILLHFGKPKLKLFALVPSSATDALWSMQQFCKELFTLTYLSCVITICPLAGLFLSHLKPFLHRCSFAIPRQQSSGPAVVSIVISATERRIAQNILHITSVSIYTLVHPWPWAEAIGHVTVTSLLSVVEPVKKQEKSHSMSTYSQCFQASLSLSHVGMHSVTVCSLKGSAVD